MHTPDNDEFEGIINTQNWGPYGPSTTAAVKPGLTKRGKAALAIGVTVLAGGGMLTWQHYSAEAEANQIRVQELSLQQQQLELEKLKEINKAATQNAENQATEDAATQKLIKACVDTDKSLVGKQMGVTYSSVLEDCRRQYTTNTAGSDMQEAASTTSTDTTSGGISSSALIGIGAGAALLVAIAANRGKKTNAA
jgi:hypothetical protein